MTMHSLTDEPIGGPNAQHTDEPAPVPDLRALFTKGRTAWAGVKSATEWVDELRGRTATGTANKIEE